MFILNNNLFGAALAASFLAVLFITMRSKLTLIAAAFLLLGFINYYLYYSIVPPQNCTVRVAEIKTSYSIGSYSGRKVILRGDMKGLKEGERIFLKGNYTSGPQFDRGIIGEIDVKSFIHTEKDLIYKVYEFKRNLFGRYKDNIGEEGAAEVMAVAFGDDSYLNVDTMDEMSELGIVHVISVSGLHMALIYKVCEMLLGFGGGMAVSVIYCLFTGAAPSAVRSLVMIIVLKLSRKVYKNYDPLSSLCLAAIIVIMLKPSNALDLGSLLSFLAVLGIFLHYEKIKRVLWRIPLKLNESASLTISAQVYSLPVCIMAFNSISTASIQGNIFIVPLYSIILVLGNLSMIFVNLDSIFKGFCFFIKLVFESIDGGRSLLQSFSTGLIYMSYVDGWVLVIIYISYMLYKRVNRRFIWLPLFSVFFYAAASFSPFPQFEYAKVGNSNAVIYRHGFKSILFLNKSQNTDDEIMLCKKFNVWRIEDSGREGDFTYREKGLSFTVVSNKNDVRILLLQGKDELKMAFADESVSASMSKFYDIIYLPYKKTYHFYDELLHVLIICGKPIKL
ncbi:MAG: ComEC/Rec2 family competence protein [Bacillota bacterium]|nr:ComEC/Rec2 family competence protein [Bacillota bacterium]